MSVAKATNRRGRAASVGYTLVELLVTLMVVSIVSAIAFPSFRDMTRNMTVSSATNDLVGALNVARSEAVKRGNTVNVVSKAGSSDWTGGWSVIANGETLRVYPALPADYSITADASGGDDSLIGFSPRGDIGGSNFKFSVCRPDHDTAHSRLVIVAASGLVRTVTGSADLTCS